LCARAFDGITRQRKEIGTWMNTGKRISVGVGRILKLQKMRAVQRKTRIATDVERGQAGRQAYMVFLVTRWFPRHA
jgi:hypothetical protein